MRTMIIVITPPRFDQLLGMRDRHEAVHVEAFVAQPSVETLDKRILYGLSGPDEVQRDTPAIRPVQVKSRVRSLVTNPEGEGKAMKKSRYTEEQVAYALRLAESGTPVADVCRQTGIAEATFYLWKKKFGSLGVPEVRELRQMREENARLKRLVADLTLDKQILQDVLRKKV
jgi:putative transposase